MGPPGALISSTLISRDFVLGPRWGLVLLAALGLVSVLLLWTRLPRHFQRPEARPPETRELQRT